MTVSAVGTQSDTDEKDTLESTNDTDMFFTVCAGLVTVLTQTVFLSTVHINQGLGRHQKPKVFPDFLITNIRFD